MAVAGVYLRVSSTDGRQDEQNQTEDCVRLCQARGWATRWFVERESAGKARPVWSDLLERARIGELDAVVFWALDRAGRSRIQVAHDLGELFRFGVQVASVQDAWLDMPPGPMRDLLVQIMGWVAEGERDRLIARTHAGLARARAKGQQLGRPRTLTDAAVERARALRAEGKSWTGIVVQLELEGMQVSKGAISRALGRSGT